MSKKGLRILFIGNSHTYYHDLPAWVALMAKEDGYECDVTMLAHGGWYLYHYAVVQKGQRMKVLRKT